MTPPTQDMGVDPISLNTTTMSIVTMGCSSAVSAQVKRNLNEYQPHWNKVLINFEVATEFVEILH